MDDKNAHRSFWDGMDVPAEYLSVLNAVLVDNMEILPHQHSWGQLNVISAGVMMIHINNERDLIAPWQYAAWIPPGVLHSSFNKKGAEYCSIAIPCGLCQRLPQSACILELTEINRAVINDILQRKVSALSEQSDARLALVMIDQLAKSAKTPTWLPETRDKFLSPVIEFLLDNPGDNQTLSEWAAKVYTSEKTLSRRFNEQLHMSFREWRARLRFIRSLPLLKTSLPVQEIAWQLGYSNPSSFIVMFMKISGTTPDKYRRGFFAG